MTREKNRIARKPRKIVFGHILCMNEYRKILLQSENTHKPQNDDGGRSLYSHRKEKITNFFRSQLYINMYTPRRQFNIRIKYHDIHLHIIQRSTHRSCYVWLFFSFFSFCACCFTSSHIVVVQWFFLVVCHDVLLHKNH